MRLDPVFLSYIYWIIFINFWVTKERYSSAYSLLRFHPFLSAMVYYIIIYSTMLSANLGPWFLFFFAVKDILENAIHRQERVIPSSANFLGNNGIDSCIQ